MNIPDARAITVDRFKDWLVTARPNDKLVYYTGETLTYSLMASHIKKEVWEMALNGHVYLVQKKLGVGLYEFITVKASKSPCMSLIPVRDYSDKNHVSKLQTYTNRQVRLLERVAS
jgi:hypothetical protein